MDRILLIRHAQAEGHESDDPALSTTGRQQVAALAAQLAAIAQAWQELTERSAGRTLFAITHAFVIGSFVGLALEAAPDAWMRLPIANSSITEVQSRPFGQWAVASVSDTGHLLQG